VLPATRQVTLTPLPRHIVKCLSKGEVMKL